MHAGRLAAVATVIGILSLGVRLRAEEPEPAPPAARQNPILRAYFEKQYQSMGLPAEPPSRGIFLNQYIDNQIDHYLERVSRQMDELEESFEQVQAVQRRLAGSSGPTADILQVWRRSLDQMAGKASDLRRTLAFVFLGLRSSSDRPSVDSRNRESAYSPEVDYIGDQILRATRQIENYLFKATNTVALEEIQGENMLVNLRRAEEMAKLLRDLP